MILDVRKNKLNCGQRPNLVHRLDTHRGDLTHCPKSDTMQLEHTYANPYIEENYGSNQMKVFMEV